MIDVEKELETHRAFARMLRALDDPRAAEMDPGTLKRMIRACRAAGGALAEMREMMEPEED